MEKRYGFLTRVGWRKRGLIVACIILVELAFQRTAQATSLETEINTQGAVLVSPLISSGDLAIEDFFADVISDYSTTTESVLNAIKAARTTTSILPTATASGTGFEMGDPEFEIWPGSVSINLDGDLTVTNTSGNSAQVFFLCYDPGVIPVLVLTNSESKGRYKFLKSKKPYGGTVENHGGYVYIESADFVDGISTTTVTQFGGGAIYNVAESTRLGYMILSDVEFKNNEAKNKGGAIFNGSYLYVNNGRFTNNTAAVRGGAYDAYAGSVNILVDAKFNGNKATGGFGGGAYYADGGTTNILVNPVFDANNATAYGGAYYADTGNRNTFINSIFKNNSAIFGGAIFVVGGAIQFISEEGKKTIFESNYSTHSTTPVGGAIFAYSAAIVELSGKGDFYFGNENSTFSKTGTNVDNVDSIYMVAGGKFTKSGTGILQLVGSHRIDTSSGGKFEIEAGTLRIANSGSEVLNTSGGASDSFILSSVNAARLEGFGTIKADGYTLNNVTFSPDGAILTPTGNHDDEISADPIGQLSLTTGNVNISGNTVFKTDVKTATDHDLVDVTGTATVASGSTVKVDPTLINGFIPAVGTQIDVLKTTGLALSGVIPTFTNGDTSMKPTGFNAAHEKLEVKTDANNIYLLASSASADITWTGATDSTWKNSNTLNNWKDDIDGLTTYFLDADNVTFNASGKQGTVTVDATGVKPDNMYVTAGDYTFEGGAITATGDITISGGKATFDTDFGATTVTVGSAATLGVTNPHTLTGDLNASGATLNFTAPLNAPSGTKILSVTGNATIPNTSVNVAIPGTASPLQIGDFLVLIDAAGSLVGKPLTTVASALGMQGVTIDYEFALSTTAKQLIATLQESPAANPQSKSLSEGFVSGVAVITETSDFTANEGMSAAVDAVGHDTTAIDYKAFGAVGGGNIRYNTGSHVDLKSFSAVAGIAKGFSLKKSYLTLGAFFEYGSGSYDTYNSFSGVAFHGDGDITHIGGGILGKAEFNRTDRGQGYFEGSVRAGEVKNTYTNKDMNVGGVNASYKAKSSYAGFHLGTGYIFAVNPKADLDLYTKYYFTRQGKDDVTLTTGDPIHFDAVKSSRVRVGARLSGKGKVVSPYIGAAIEREFDGQAKATAFGLPIDAPSLKGNTGIGELGLTLRPAKAPGLSINLGLQGYVGKREGVSGSFRLRYEF